MGRYRLRQGQGAKLRFVLLWVAALCLYPAAPALAQNAPDWNPQGLLIDVLSWIDGLGLVGPLAFMGLYVLVTVSFLPASVITLGAGVVFGLGAGSLWVFLGAMLGATAAFLLGRYVARDWVARKIAGNTRFQAVDSAIGQQGLKIIFLLRLSPAFPFNLLNYSLGLTQVSLKDYILGTTGILPGTIMYVYLGSLVGNLALLGSGTAPENPGIIWAIRIIGAIATIAVTVYVTRIARNALQSAIPAAAGSTESDETQLPPPK